MKREKIERIIFFKFFLPISFIIGVEFIPELMMQAHISSSGIEQSGKISYLNIAVTDPMVTTICRFEQ